VTIEEALVVFLRGLGHVGDRVYPMRLPQGSILPAIVFQGISHTREDSHSGPSLPHPRIQLNCWAETYGGAKNLSRQVRVALDGYRGTWSGVEIQRVKVANMLDDQEEELSRYRVIIDIIVWYREEEVA
jgi:hypothetical protein